VLAGAAALTLVGSSGCSLLGNAYKQIRRHECLDEFMLAHRNRVFAAKAWHRVKHCYANQPHLSEFKAGFIDGYIEVASGGAGCLPAVAPSQYWGWRYQSPDGQAAINAWFAGYPMGVKAAEQDGVGYWGQVPSYSRSHHEQPTESETAPETAVETELDPAQLTGPDGQPILPEEVVPGSARIMPAEEAAEMLPSAESPELLETPTPRATEEARMPAPVDGANTNLPAGQLQLPAMEFEVQGTPSRQSERGPQPQANRRPATQAPTYSLNDLSRPAAQASSPGRPAGRAAHRAADRSAARDAAPAIERSAQDRASDGAREVARGMDDAEIETIFGTLPLSSETQSAAETADATNEIPFKFE
jgi:hypothetical protein